MESDLNILIATAFSVGLLHTLLGPDHYVPFVAMSKSSGWTAKKTFWVTVLCGLGHVAGSVVIGSVGILLGTALFHIEALESWRGEVAAWLLIGFGLAYFVWGMVQATRGVSHTHLHRHVDGTVHSHEHVHDATHCHVSDVATVSDPGVDEIDAGRRSPSLTPWVLFLIFAFGPCEVLIPLLMYPAAEANWMAIGLVVGAFTLATVGTMVASVMLLVFGMQYVRLPDLHRYSHALAGFAAFACGMMVKLGW